VLDLKQVSKVIWQKAASPPYTYSSPDLHVGECKRSAGENA